MEMKKNQRNTLPKEGETHPKTHPEIPVFRGDIFQTDEALRPKTRKNEETFLPQVPVFRADIFQADEVHRKNHNKNTINGQDLPETPVFRSDIFLEYGVDSSEDFASSQDTEEKAYEHQIALDPEIMEERKRNQQNMPETPTFREDVFSDYGEGFQKDTEGLWKNQYQKDAEAWATNQEIDPEEERRCNEIIGRLEGDYLEYERPFTIRKQEEIQQEFAFFKDILPLTAYFTGESLTMFQFWLCNLSVILFCQTFYILLTYWATAHYHYFAMVLVAFSGKFLGLFQVTSAIQILRQLVHHKGDLPFYVFTTFTFHPITFMVLYLSPMDLLANIFQYLFG